MRCFLNFRGNLERKLQELGIPRPVSNEIIKDIMGYPSQLQYGLVDAQSTEQLDEMLAKLKGCWSELERPYNSPPFFHKWFLKHCRDNVARYMLRDAREKAGLGSPPAPYYTNEVESKNKVLKCEVQYKSFQLPDFVDKMRSVMEEQQWEIERAVVNIGEYRLRKEYRHLSVESSKWFKLTSDQRKRKIDRLMKAPFVLDLPSTSHSSTSIPCPLDSVQIPSHRKFSRWEKAKQLSEDESSIVQAPGDADGWMVKSYSGPRPHYIRKLKNSIACDDHYLSYNSMKICSHTVALALKTQCLSKFLKWFVTSKHSPNFTSLAEAGKPASAGKKPTRKGVSKKCSEQIKTIVADAEESSVQWENPITLYDSDNCGARCHSSPLGPFPSDSIAAPSPTPSYVASLSSPTTTYLVSNRNVHIGNIGAASIPPPLIPTHPEQPYSGSPRSLPPPVLGPSVSIDASPPHLC